MKKSLIAAYGVLSYGVFLGAFLYAIVFVGNLFIETDFITKTIDFDKNAGADDSVVVAIIINALLLGLFAVQHSLMARPAFKDWWTKIIGKAAERSTFVLFSSLALVLMYWQWRPIHTEIWSVQNETLGYVLWGVYFLGWGIVFFSTWMISHFELFGLKQVYDNMKGNDAAAPPFQVNFFYKIVRHPLMVGFIIAFWATPHMSLGHLIFALATTGYIIIAVTFFEEPDLKKAIGKEYEDYQKEVPMFVPFSK
jgi:protein-S-isoprenylcysteine O-methyltransferase Ste14